MDHDKFDYHRYTSRHLDANLKYKKNNRNNIFSKIGSGFKSLIFTLFIIYLIFNYLQMIGLSHYITNDDYRENLAKITIFPIRNETKIALEIYKQTNELRTSVGSPVLYYELSMSYLAQNWSETLQDRLFVLEHSNYARLLNFGENVGEVPISIIPFFIWIQDCIITITDQQVANCHMLGWKNSPGHYANLINPGYIFIGVGVSCGLLDCKATQMFT